MAGFLAAGLSSCSEDFEVAAPYREVTVVYGLLNMADTAHYVRVQKAFLDDSKSALDMAREADSNFYRGLVVVMREIDTVSNKARVTLPMELKNLEGEGYPKQPGAFFNTPNLAYKLKHALDPRYKYRIVVTHANGEVDSAETGILSNDKNVFKVNEFDNVGNYSIVFGNPSDPAATYALQINPRPPYSRLFEGTLRFHYVNKDLNTNVQTDMPPLNFNFDLKDVPGTGRVSLSIPQISIYNFLKAGMQAPPAHIVRYMDSCDVIVWAGSHEMGEYRRFSMLQGGLTGDQIKPIYTNVKGANVLGLFASRVMRSRINIPISKPTMDTLMAHPITVPLQIKGVSDH